MPLGALYPSKSGPMNKHIVKHSLTYRETYRNSVVYIGCLIGGALCPSKSGLMNKHIVKHIVKHVRLSPD